MHARADIPPLPDDYPLFDVSDADVAFSTASGIIGEGGYYLRRSPPQYGLVPREWENKASHLFFRGGGLAAVGLKPREGYDLKRIMRALRFLLSSFEPSHEQKEATVGFALMKWCEPIDAEPPSGVAKERAD